MAAAGNNPTRICEQSYKRLLWLIPLITSIWIFCSLWICYFIADSKDHIEIFPYISYTGTEVPERGVFGFLINLGAALLTLVVLVRYLHAKTCLLKANVTPTKGWFIVNKVGLCVGLISALGICMVANFETKVMRVPHYIGAISGFGFAAVYCWLQTVLSFKILPRTTLCGKCFWIVQTVISILYTFFLILFMSTRIYIWKKFSSEEYLKWEDIKGIYLTCAISEWIVACLILVFSLTFIPSFKKWRVTLILKGHLETKTARKMEDGQAQRICPAKACKGNYFSTEEEFIVHYNDFHRKYRKVFTCSEDKCRAEYLDLKQCQRHILLQHDSSTSLITETRLNPMFIDSE